MEDPWGSPWATTDASTPKLDLPSAPPTAHFSVESTSNSQKTLQNPWEDNEAWGGWNDAAAGTPGAAPAAGSIGRKRSGVFGSPGWGGLSPAAQPAVVPTSRGVSPDPWRLSDGRMSDGRRSVSRERSFQELQKRKSDASLGVGSEGPEVDRLSVGNAFGLRDVWGPQQQGDDHSTHRVSMGGKAVEPDPKPVASIAIPAEIATVSPEATQASPSESPSVLSEESPTTSEAHSISRPDSPVGIAPRPAIRPVDDDEDQDQDRKVSTKVQELVEMYDGISRNASRNASPSIGATSPITPTGLSMTPIKPKPEPSSPVQGSDVSPAVEPTKLDEEVQLTDDTDTPQSPAIHAETNNIEVKAVVSSPAPHPSSKEPSKVRPINFLVDMSKLDDLFPDTPPAQVEPDQVPDVVIDDSFSSISERKTWYRISRLGAMRMHQMGDDENYVRVDWKRSAARQDTLKIVRRWMEEETGGRPALGRKVGAVGGSVFNWNSSAPPVEIGELLRKRGGHSKGGSSASRTSGILSPATAEFGWGSPPVSPIVSTRPPPSPVTRTHEPAARTSTSNRPQSIILPPVPAPPSESSSREFSEPPKLQPVPIITRSIDVANRPSIDQALSRPIPAPILVNGSRGSFSDDKDASADDDDDEEEDDWGEMVTSPTAETSPWPTGVPVDSPYNAELEVSTNMEDSKTLSEDTSLDESKEELESPGWPRNISQQEDDPPPATFGDMGLLPTRTGMVAPQHPLSVSILKTKNQVSASIDSALAWTGEPSSSKTLSPLLTHSPPPPPVPPKSPLNPAATQSKQISLVDDEEAATSILKDLPDFSYMLR